VGVALRGPLSRPLGRQRDESALSGHGTRTALRWRVSRPRALRRWLHGMSTRRILGPRIGIGPSPFLWEVPMAATPLSRSRVVIGYATHVEDCVSVLPDHPADAASDILNHLDLISCPPDIVVDALPIRLRRLLSHRVPLRLLRRLPRATPNATACSCVGAGQRTGPASQSAATQINAATPRPNALGSPQ
jgi:hypothetical protein